MSYELLNTFASLPATKRGFPIVVNGDPKGKNYLYCCGMNVYMREIENPDKCDVYSEHAKNAVCARYCPSGFYIASGDEAGNLRIWDTTQETHLLKNEFQPISGAIKDIAWDADSKRIIVGGEGRETFGAAIMWDSGNTIGSLTGQGKSLNSVDFKQTRPYRAITGSEDFTSAFFEGPPFKFKQSNKDHNRFVQTVRFSPNGELYATGAADGKIFVYNGRDSTLVQELGSPAHAGGIYAISWSPDSKRLLSASGDKSCKIWNMESFECETTFKMGDKVEDQQLGCLWQGDHLLTVSLSGAINYLDKENPDTPKQVIWGHNKLITAMVTSEDGSTIYTADFGGRVVRWDAASGKSEPIGGVPHTNEVTAMTVVEDQIASVGVDDKMRFISIADKKYIEKECSLDAQPKSIASGQSGLIVIGAIKEVYVYRKDEQQRKSSLSVDYEAISVAVHPSQQDVAVGSDTGKIFLYGLESNDNLTLKMTVLEDPNPITTLAFSPDGTRLAAGVQKYLKLVETSDYKTTKEDLAHQAKINSVSWSPDSKHIATGSLDTGIVVWSAENTRKNQIKMLRAHPKAVITAVRWLDNTTVVSSGHDNCVRKWKITPQ